MCEDTVMKLFNQLLVAPAALGLMAPISAIASEVNISEMASYSDIELAEEEELFYHNSFDNPLATTNTSAETELGSLETFEAGGFSDTTVATQTAQFIIAGTDGEPGTDDEAVQANYYYGLTLDTSFTGDDNLNVALEAGNTNAGITAASYLDFGTTGGDGLTVADINYTRSFGDLVVTVGDSLDASANFAGACAYSGFTDQLSDCGTGLSAGLGGDVTVSSAYDFGNGFVVGFGLTGAEGSATDGLFTNESIDAYAIQAAYSTDTYGFALSYSDIDSHAAGTAIIGTEEDWTVWGLNGYYNFEGPIENLSVGYEMGNPATGNDTTNWFAGITTSEVGAGSISFALGTTTHIVENAEDTLQYEVSYNWDVNDSTSMTVGGFIVETATAGAADATGLAFTTTFSF